MHGDALYDLLPGSLSPARSVAARRCLPGTVRAHGNDGGQYCPDTYSTTAQTINLSATVLSAPAVNSGYVWFALLGSRVAAPVVNGTASATFTVPGATPQGTYPVEVTYVPDNSVHITDFNKSNNIYTNLDQEFPHTGTGTPGSGVGTPNASYLYVPAAYTTPSLVPIGDMVTAPVVFELTSNSNGQDFDEVTSNSNALAITTSVPSTTAVHLLTASYGGADYNIYFTGDGGATETFGVIHTPDFCNGGTQNASSAMNGSATNNVFTQSVLEVQNIGACGTGTSAPQQGGNDAYFLYDQTFALSSAFAGQNLKSITIVKVNGGSLLVLGVTADRGTGPMLASSGDNTADLVVGQASSAVTWANITAGDAGPIPVSNAAQTITLHAAVTGDEPITDGSVTFTLLGTTVEQPVSNGAASTTFTVPANTPPGSYPITATYTPPGNAVSGTFFLTDFLKNNNIYTELNQQYPNSGPGTPGTKNGTSNAGFLYDPSTYSTQALVSGSDLATNGSHFLIASNSTGQDFEQITYGSPLMVREFVPEATSLSLLTAAYTGTTYNVTVTGDGGATETFTNVPTNNFCNGGTLNNNSTQNGSVSNNVFDQSVLEVQDTGGCGTGNSATGGNTAYYLYEQTFLLNSAFSNQNVTSVVITNNSGNGLLLFGATANAVVSSSTDVQHQLIVVSATVPTITWANPGDIVAGTPLGSTQLNASATVAGTFVYNPPTGTVLQSGSNQPLSVTFLPADTADYAIATDTVYINVTASAVNTATTAGNVSATYSPAAQNVTLSAAVTSSSAVNGGTVMFTVLGASVSAAVTNGTASTTFTIPAGTEAGSYTILATYIPTSGFTGSSDKTHSLNIGRATPTIQWSNPADITSGTALSAVQLDAKASVAGSYAYNPAANTVLPAGSKQTLSVTFTPTDTNDYTTATATAYINVNAKTTVSGSNVSITYHYGSPAPEFTAIASVTSSSQVNGGTVTFSLGNLPAGAQLQGNTATVSKGVAKTQVVINTSSLPAGTYPLTATYHPAAGLVGTIDTAHHLMVIPAVPTISWTTPAAIVFGTALSSTQLNASAKVAGTFAYSPAAGAVPGVGADTLSVTFTPTDSKNYKTATASVQLTVQPPQASLTVSFLFEEWDPYIAQPFDSFAYIAFTNTGTIPLQNVQVTTGSLALKNIGTYNGLWADLGTGTLAGGSWTPPSSAGAALPLNLGTIAPGATVNAVVTFVAPKTLPTSTPSVISVGGTYNGGSFSAVSRGTM